jgi:hypothetical protein
VILLVDAADAHRSDEAAFGRQRVAVAAALVSAAPLILLAFNRDWLLTHEGWLDPWHYVGFFREYWNPDYSPQAYKLARLPWILAGALVTSMLPPLAAAYVLHLAFLCATTAAMFLGTYWLFQRISLSAVVALFIGFYTHAHGSGGWDYHNTAAGAFYVGTFMALASPSARAGRPAALIVAGVLAALTIHSNITFVNFLPALAFVYLRSVQVGDGALPGAREAARRAAWAAIGALGVTLALGAVNWAAGREFLFFWVLLDIVARYVADPRYVEHWRLQGAWYLTADHLALPAAVFVAGLATRFRRRARPPVDPLASALVVQFLAMAVVWIGWQAAGQLALDWPYFAYVLVPSCFIAIAGLLAPVWPELLDRQWAGAAIAATAALAIGLGADWPGLSSLERAVAPAITPVAGAIFAAALTTGLRARRRLAVLALVGLFAAGNRLSAGDAASDYGAADPCKTQPDVYGAVIEAASWMGRTDPTFTRMRTWFQQDETLALGGGCSIALGPLGGSITTMAFVPYLTSPYPMPAVRDVPSASILALATDDSWLVIMTDAQDNLDAWERRLRSLGLEKRERARHRVPLRASGFSVHVWAVFRRPPDGVAFTDRIIDVTHQTTPEISVYGVPPGRLEPTPAGPRFSPTHPRDHIGYPMAKVPPSSDDSWARLTVETSAPTASSCRVTIQDQQLATVAATPCESGVRYFMLPANTTTIRAVIAGAAGKAFILPDRIEVARGAAAAPSR